MELQLCETPPKTDGTPFRNLEYVWFPDNSYLILRKTLFFVFFPALVTCILWNYEVTYRYAPQSCIQDCTEQSSSAG